MILEANIYTPYYYYKLDTLLNANLKIPDSCLIIATQYYFDKKLIFKYSIIEYNRINGYCNNANRNVFEIIQCGKDIYYKLPFDFEIIADENEDIFSVVIKVVTDIVEFLNKIFNINIETSKIFITSSCGIKNNQYKHSYHVILPVILKWRNISIIYNILNSNIFEMYNSLFSKKYNIKSQFIDTSITKRTQNFRCLYQSKFGDSRIQLPIQYENFGYSLNTSDYIIGVYNPNDINNYIIIDDNLNYYEELSKIDDEIIKIHKDFNKYINTTTYFID